MISIQFVSKLHSTVVKLSLSYWIGLMDEGGSGGCFGVTFFPLQWLTLNIIFFCWNKNQSVCKIECLLKYKGHINQFISKA